MRIEPIDTPERLQELAGAWSNLLDGNDPHEIFATWRWVRTWHESVGARAGARLAVWVVRDGDRPAAIFPLQRSRRLGLEILEFTGFPRHADRMEIVADPDRLDAACRAFAAGLAERRDWDVLSLRCFGAEKPQPEVLARALDEAGLCNLLRDDAVTYYIDLRPYADLDAYLGDHRSRRTRKALRRHARRLQEDHRGEWRVHRRLDDSLLEAMADLDVNRSVRGADDRAFFGDPDNLSFFRGLARRSEGHDPWRITALQDGDRLLAYDMSFQHLGRRLSYQTAYDVSLAAYGVGNLALVEAIGGAIAEGCREFDFMAGDEGYKENWCRDGRRCRWLLAFSGTARSRLAWSYERHVKPLRTRLAGGPVARLVPRSLRDRLDV